MTRAKPYDWNTLKADYILGEHESVASYFEAKHPEITSDTYEKKTKGWRDERRLYTAKAAAKALEKAANKRADMLARHAAAGQLLQTVGLNALVDQATGKVRDGMTPDNPKQAADIIKAGADIEREALLSEDAATGLPAVDLAVGVELGPDDIKQIRIFARAYGRRKALGGAP
jgi:hypothetical protein